MHLCTISHVHANFALLTWRLLQSLRKYRERIDEEARVASLTAARIAMDLRRVVCTWCVLLIPSTTRTVVAEYDVVRLARYDFVKNTLLD